ncbi:MAG TPA: GNAT family protein [Symbiobacteriaceae bacterium]|nr:GNAT family protein [Symbiobacteriaceae bacterium]
MMGTDLRLRPAVLPDDVSHALPWYRDPEVLYGSEGVDVAPYDFDGILGMYKYLTGIGELYIVEVAGPDGWLPVGDVTLAPHTLPIVIGDAAYRSKGLGKRVIALLVERARSLGWERLAVKSIYTYNLRSRRLFEGAGFRITRTWVDERGQEAWSMELPL